MRALHPLIESSLVLCVMWTLFLVHSQLNNIRSYILLLNSHEVPDSFIENSVAQINYRNTFSLQQFLT